jgi:flavin-dependent dehydrogenase
LQVILAEKGNMAGPKTITIIGGGLAGLTLGIALRRREIPVTVWEAGSYPRHRVCGEFISGIGQKALERLGLRSSLPPAGATQATTAAFFLPRAGSAPWRLPVPALCLDRFTLDALLAEQFRHCGGDLREHCRWRGEAAGEGLVRANGRNLQLSEAGWGWFGLKIHARDVRLAADLEMHAQPAGYVGICRLGGGRVNVCGLFRRRAETPACPLPPEQLLRGSPGTVLHGRLAGAAFDDASFCSVAGLPLRPQRSQAMAGCRIGDALTMIPPITGNGMSMAFEAAELALEPLSAYSRGEIPWTEAQQTTVSACETAFARRLEWSRRLQWMMFTPLLRGRWAGVPLRCHWLWRLLFDRTR